MVGVGFVSGVVKVLRLCLRVVHAEINRGDASGKQVAARVNIRWQAYEQALVFE